MIDKFDILNFAETFAIIYIPLGIISLCVSGVILRLCSLTARTLILFLLFRNNYGWNFEIFKQESHFQLPIRPLNPFQLL